MVCLDQQCETRYGLKMSDGRCYGASLLSVSITPHPVLVRVPLYWRESEFFSLIFVAPAVALV